MIQFSWGDYIVFILFFFVLVELIIVFSKKNYGINEYLLGGRKLTLPIFVLTMFSTWYGGILGVGEFGYLYGVSSWFLQGVPYYFFAILFAFIFASKARQMEVSTTCEQIQKAYGKNVGMLSAVYTTVLSSPAPYVLMAAVLIQMVFTISLLASLVLAVVFSIAYLLRGGFVADRATDVFFAILMFAGFFIILPFLWIKFGGIGFVIANTPQQHQVWHGGNSPQFIVMWFLIALWTWVEPTFYQRCYAAKDPSVAKKGILWSVFFWFIFDMMTLTAAMYARAALPNLQDPMMAYPALAQAVLPSVVKGFFFVGMMATILSTLNSQFFISSTSMGRDFLAHIMPSTFSSKRWIQWGLVFIGGLAIVMALAVPSVVRLWYTIGTIMIPGLLIPMVSSFFPKAQPNPSWMFASMFFGTFVSLLCLLVGWSSQMGAYDQYPFGVEPIFPGLLTALLLYFGGLLKKRVKV